MRVGVVRAAVPGGAVEVEIFDQVHASHHRGAELPVGREDPVGFLQGVRAPHLRRLLADEGRIDRQLSLALERRRLDVGPTCQGHQAIEVSQLLVFQAERRQVWFGLALHRDDADRTLRLAVFSSGGRGPRPHERAPHPRFQILDHPRPPGTQYRRTRPILPMRSRAKASAAADVEMWRSRAMWKIWRSVR